MKPFEFLEKFTDPETRVFQGATVRISLS